MLGLVNLDCFTYQGTLTVIHPLGFNSLPIAFSLILAPDADKGLLEYAEKSIAQVITTSIIGDSVDSD